MGRILQGDRDRAYNVYAEHMMPRKGPSVNVAAEPAPPGASKRAYHHGNLRTALVDAAIDVLEAQPHAEIRVRELARRVGVSPNAAYRHFADRDALLAAVAAEGFRRFGAAASRLGKADSPDDALRGLGSGYVRFARANPALFRLMFGPTDRLSTDELQRTSGATFEVLRSAVAAALGAPSNDPRVTAGTIYAWSLVHGLSYLALDRRLDDAGDPDELIEAVLDLAQQHG